MTTSPSDLPMDAGDLTLHQTLAALGMTTERAEHGKKHVQQDGTTLFTGTAWEVTRWLRETGRIR